MRLLFEDYVLDPARRELALGLEPIATGPKVFDVLLYLVQNCDHVVSKENLLDVVWEGRIVSESTLFGHINAVRKAIGDNGTDQRLIKTISRKGFRFVGHVREEPSPAAHPSEVARPLLLPDRPSIVVLPFLNLSGDLKQDYFVDGMVEDIISALSRVGWLFVIARNSSFTYKGRAVDLKQVGRELGVGYVLEGSMRKATNRVRISGQLIDTTTGANLWAERFESNVDDVFDLQDEVATRVVGAIAPQLERAEITRANRKPTDSLDAYDHYLRGMAHFHRGTKESTSQALPLFYKAIELDPDFASAYGMAAACHFWRKLNNRMTDSSGEVSEGIRLARRAVELGKDDAVALARAGHALAILTSDLDFGVELTDRALVLNPNLAAAWFLGAFLRTWRGEPDEAIERLTRAMRLSPLDSEMYRMESGMAHAHLLARRFDLASSWAEKALRGVPTIVFIAAIGAASHALAHRPDEAQRAMEHLRRLDPTLRLSSLKDWLPLRRSEDLATIADGLRKAGLPE